MSRRVLFITHAEVVIDPAIPVPEWPLSPTGRARHLAFNRTGPIAGVTTIASSHERKARDGAAILAAALGRDPVVMADLHENDRSATGYLPRAEFERTADAFFANPLDSIRGWEPAVDARRRIVAGVDAVLEAHHDGGDLAIVAHGGVGALLLSHLLRAPISRRFDQPAGGGGHWFAFRAGDRMVLNGWRDIGRAAGQGGSSVG